MSSEVKTDDVGSQPGDVELTEVTTRPESMADNADKADSTPGANGNEGSNPMVMLRVVNTESSVDSETPKEDDVADGINLTPQSLGPLLSTNQYTLRKMAAQGLMDVALMMANISQLRTLITAGPDMECYYILVYLVSFSLVAQVAFAIIIFIIWMRETEDNYREEFMATILQVAASKRPESEVAKESIILDKAKQEEKYKRHKHTNRLNYCTIVLVFTITVTNMFITGFGIKLKEPEARMGSFPVGVPTSNLSGIAGVGQTT